MCSSRTPGTQEPSPACLESLKRPCGSWPTYLGSNASTHRWWIHPKLNVEKPPQHEQRASSDTVWYNPRESWTSRFRMLQKLLMGRTWVPMEAEHHMHSYARFPTLHSTWTIISNYHIISCLFLWLISWYQLNILRIGHLISPLSGSSANSATQQRATRDDGNGASDLAIWYPLVMTNTTIEHGWTWPICPFSSLIYLLDMVIVHVRYVNVYQRLFFGGQNGQPSSTSGPHQWAPWPWKISPSQSRLRDVFTSSK